MKVRTTLDAGFEEVVRIGQRWFAQWNPTRDENGVVTCWRTEIDSIAGEVPSVEEVTAAIEREERTERDARIAELKAYLTETDYVVIRAVETGEEEPAEVRTKRIAARQEINELEALI